MWFSNVPTVGVVPANQPARITVQPDLSGRSPGIDRGVITLLFDDGSVQTVNILSVVPPPGTVPGLASGRKGENAASGCTPSRLAIQVTSPSLSAPRGQINQPMSLEAQVADDCGNPIKDTNGAVKVTFSTGEAGSHPAAHQQRQVGEDLATENRQPHTDGGHVHGVRRGV